MYVMGFWLLSVVCLLLFFYTRTAVPTRNDSVFSKFQRSFLVVYLLATAGDWLQGPYVYALYAHYGMSKHDIDILFVAGFGSSMLVGTFIGSVADKYGRKANCILYGILYGLACITKHFNNFWILMLGRLLGGTATSILYSAFESWLVNEHHKLGFDDESLGTIFSHSVLGNSIVAIIAGLIAQQSADYFGYVAPFDVSLICLMIMCTVTWFTWTENYGNQKTDVKESFKSALKSIQTDRKILCLGLIQSLFEGSMYTFVLEWTPALTPAPPAVQMKSLPGKDQDGDGHVGSIPHGYIFAGFMVAIMIGSSLFKLLCKYTNVESFMRVVLAVSACSLMTPILFPENYLIIFIGFLVFETCVGIFWPSLSTMRGKYVPEETRATIMNCFRIPLNLIVVLILTQDLNITMVFRCCVLFLFLATLAQQWLNSLVPQKHDADQKAGHEARLISELEQGTIDIST